MSEQRVRDTLRLQKARVEAGEATFEELFEDYVKFAWSFLDEADRLRTWALEHQEDTERLREAIERALAGRKADVGGDDLAGSVYRALWEGENTVLVEVAFGKIRLPRENRTLEQIAGYLADHVNGAITVDGVEFERIKDRLVRKPNAKSLPEPSLQAEFLERSAENKGPGSSM